MSDSTRGPLQPSSDEGRVAVSVIIINWNTVKYLASCLDSLRDGGMDGVDAEAWVIDNASTDGSAEMVRARYPWVRLQANADNLGFAVANNAVMRVARGDFLLLLNADMVVPRGVIAGLVSRMRERPEVGAAGCRQLNADGDELESYMFDYIGDRIPEVAPLPPRPVDAADEVEVSWVWGSGMMIRREVFEQTGGFDESFFMYYEDLDWCRRIRSRGWKIVCRLDLHVTHFARRSTSLVPPKTTAARLVVGELALLERHLPAACFRRMTVGKFFYSFRGVLFYRVMLALAPCERYRTKYFRYRLTVGYIANHTRGLRGLAWLWRALVRSRLALLLFGPIERRRL